MTSNTISNIKVLGAMCHTVYSILTRTKDDKDDAIVDFAEIAKMTKLRESHIKNAIYTLCVCGLLRKTGYNTFKTTNKYVLENMTKGYISQELFIQEGDCLITRSWLSMIHRCLNLDSYHDVVWSEDFMSVDVFGEWCQKQEYYRAKDDNGKSYHMDKDLLSPRHKREYGKNTCTFLPAELNLLIGKRRLTKDGLTTGISYRKRDNVYSAKLINNGETIALGDFYSKEEASEAYFEAKRLIIIDTAEKWKGRIEDVAYGALLDIQAEDLYTYE